VYFVPGKLFLLADQYLVLACLSWCFVDFFEKGEQTENRRTRRYSYRVCCGLKIALLSLIKSYPVIVSAQGNIGGGKWQGRDKILLKEMQAQNTLNGRYSSRASFTHMIDIVPVKCVKTFFFFIFWPLCSEFNFRIQLVTSFKYNPASQLWTTCTLPSTTHNLFEYTQTWGVLKEVTGCPMGDYYDQYRQLYTYVFVYIKNRIQDCYFIKIVFINLCDSR
jgi:hypothetical protein